MSRSYANHRGKQINNEIGRECRLAGDKILLNYGWDRVGSPIRKRDAKRTSHRMLRRANKVAVNSQMSD